MKLIRIVDFVQEPDDVDWLINDLLMDTGWTLLVGKSGIGKSTFAMQLCSSIQDGKPFLGRDVKQRNVLFIQADSPSPEWKLMLKRIAPLSKGWTMVEVPAQCLGNPGYVNWMVEHIHEKMRPKPGFIVFDSLYSLAHTGVNTEKVLDAINMMKLIAGGITWMLIHHPPHTESRAAGHNVIGNSSSNNWVLLQTKLRIDKGRLVPVKEVLLDRDKDGLWIPKAEKSGGYSDLMNAPVI